MSLRRVESVKTVINSRSTTPRDTLSSRAGCIYVLSELLRQIPFALTDLIGIFKERIYLYVVPNALNNSSHRRDVDCFCQRSAVVL